MAIPIEREKPIFIGPLELHFQERVCVTPDGNAHHLSDRDFEVLSRLSPDRFISEQSIAAIVALQEFPEAVNSDHPESFLQKNAIQVTIANLRRKLGIEIENRHYHGYILKL